ncbi:MAG: ribosome-binding factor A [Rickettsiales bacterium]|jgi:ribosome-binding factor A|nr:ribosome-binding factor A [Rickettsiales bacterium]
MKINYQTETKSNFQLQKSSKLQKTLADIFSKSSFSLNNREVFINIIYVDLSKNLLNAKAVVDAFGLNETQKKELVKQLNNGLSKQIRGLIAQKLHWKYVPEVIFCCQEENKKKEKILDLLKKEGQKFDE